MYVTFKLVNDGNCDYPESIKCFRSKEEAEKYRDSTDESILIEEAMHVYGDFETYRYLDITYRVGQDPEVRFKTTTSIDKSIEDIDSIHSYGETVYVDAYIKNIRDGYKQLPKILDALDMLFVNLREDEDSTIQHKIGITNINKEEFFSMIREK